MGITTRSRPRLVVGLAENYDLITAYYKCGQLGCLGDQEEPIRPDNPYHAPHYDYDYEVLAKICELRWKHKKTYEEISTEMESTYGIDVSISTVENDLRTYEIGCQQKYKPTYVKDIQEFGGVILTVDGMQPLKGKKGIYVAIDHRTGLKLGSRILPNQKEETIVQFLEDVKKRIEEEIGARVLGIVSDAHVSQRLAIEKVFPGVPHCLCHFHFFKLVLIDPKKLDSSLLTTIRSKLRKLYDIKQFKEFKARNGDEGGEMLHGVFVDKVLSFLFSLSNWARKQKDPSLSGLVLFERLSDVFSVISDAMELIDVKSFTKQEVKVIKRLHEKVECILNDVRVDARELMAIREHLKTLKEIMGDLECSKRVGLKKLRGLRDKLRKHRFSPGCGPIEREFIEALMKFVRTKGEQLFNYKIVEGAPRTNNSHELAYKQLKHLLRKVIGFHSANAYLLSHGERIVYVDPGASFTEILDVVSTMDHGEARKQIARERSSRDSMSLVMHDPPRWEKNVEELRNLLNSIEDRKIKRT